MGKSHLEARDGAGFHEQHLEFQLHHAGRRAAGRSRASWGMGAQPSGSILIIMTSRWEEECKNEGGGVPSSADQVLRARQTRLSAVGQRLMFSFLPS